MRFNRWSLAETFLWILAANVITRCRFQLLQVNGEELEGLNMSNSSESIKSDMKATSDLITDTTPPMEDSIETSSSTLTNVVQTGPFIDLLGPVLLSLQMIDETHAQINSHSTSDVLKGKHVVGLYFSADWCGPCRRFTPELAAFYQKINKRRGSSDTFAIVWISRCRDVESWGQYFTQMTGFYALPPEEAMGVRGNQLFQKYRGTSIPYLVLLEGDTADIITTDARNKIPQDKAGIGFPWRSPVIILYNIICPKSLRFILRENAKRFLGRFKAILKGMIGFG